MTPEEYDDAVAIVTASFNADRELVDRLTAGASPTALRLAVLLTTNAMRSARRRGQSPLSFWRWWCRDLAVRRAGA